MNIQNNRHGRKILYSIERFYITINKFFPSIFIIIFRNMVKPRCRICRRTFSKTNNLTRHIRFVHTKPKIIYKCKLCTLELRIYVHRRNILSHYRKTHKKNAGDAREFSLDSEISAADYYNTGSFKLLRAIERSVTYNFIKHYKFNKSNLPYSSEYIAIIEFLY